MDYSLYFISFTECFISFLRMRNQKVSLARIDIIGHQQINPILINPRTDMFRPTLPGKPLRPCFSKQLHKYFLS